MPPKQQRSPVVLWRLERPLLGSDVIALGHGFGSLCDAVFLPEHDSQQHHAAYFSQRWTKLRALCTPPLSEPVRDCLTLDADDLESAQQQLTAN